MTKHIAVLKKLERALNETHFALGEVIRVLEKAPVSSHRVTPVRRVNKKDSRILLQHDFETYFELCKQGELLDQRYKEFWLRERELVAAYNDLKQMHRHEQILTELEAVRQVMTEIEHALNTTNDT